MEGVVNHRIDCVDLVRGLCIILIVMSHTSPVYNLLDYHQMISCFRLPLYFFVSGLFFKSYRGFFDFMIRKINKLIIPFIFFYLASFLLMFVLCKCLPSLFRIPVKLSELMDIFCGHELIRYNPPIWFLLALFNCCILFYLVHFLRHTHHRLMIVVVILLGLAGFYLGKNHIELPLYIDVAMTALPFYVCGFELRHYNFFLYSHHRFDRYIPFILLILLVVMYFTASFPGMRTNYPRGNVFQLYGAGISGILFIMLLGKLIQHLPVINYLGRYSLVTLGIHGPILHFISPLIARYITNEYMFFVVALLVTLSLCLAFTPLILKLFPHLVAQKELITYHPAEH